jgi:hypothetical protein
MLSSQAQHWAIFDSWDWMSKLPAIILNITPKFCTGLVVSCKALENRSVGCRTVPKWGVFAISTAHPIAGWAA